jgi:hypothetical protein
MGFAIVAEGDWLASGVGCGGHWVGSFLSGVVAWRFYKPTPEKRK